MRALALRLPIALAVLLLLVPGWVATGRVAAATATIVALTPPLASSGAYTQAHAINAAGRIVGAGTVAIAPDGTQTYRAMVWGPDGVGTVLPAPPGGGQDSSDANAIGTDGHIVGVDYGNHHATLWRDGAAIDLGTLKAGDAGYSLANGINASGQIVGLSTVFPNGAPGDYEHAALWDGATRTDLGTFASDNSGSSQAFGINDTGQIVGYAATPPSPRIDSGTPHAALWHAGTLTDLGTLKPDNTGYSLAYAINARAQIAGEAQNTDNKDHATIWADGMKIDLGIPAGFLQSGANALNNRGQVVGGAQDPDPHKSRAYLWQGGVATDLNTLLPEGSGWVLVAATGINDAGQIIGNGTYQGATRGFVLTLPATPAPSPSPSPMPGTTFADVPMGYWAYSQIEAFARRGITTGCDTKLYCPERGVTRAEMAVFVDRTLGYGTPATPASQAFNDVPPDYWAYAYIGQFATLGITTGCGGTEFCPDRGVTRAEMAAFLIRALKQQQITPATPTFADVPADYPQYGYIEALYKSGVTTGCGTNAQGLLIFCPDRGVTRAEMAVFIIRAFP